jgi:hypothetical protein
MKYNILWVYDRYPKELIANVNDAIKAGWKLNGNLIVINGSDDHKYFYQPMIKE